MLIYKEKNLNKKNKKLYEMQKKIYKINTNKNKKSFTKMQIYPQLEFKFFLQKIILFSNLKSNFDSPNNQRFNQTFRGKKDLKHPLQFFFS